MNEHLDLSFNCQQCQDTGRYFDPRIGEKRPCPCQATPVVTGKYFGSNPTDTERISGEAIEVERYGPLKPGKAGHRVLTVYGDGLRRTAYDASYACMRDFHARRRESTRLEERGFLEKAGTLPNQAKNGRPHVDAYRITMSGRAELLRLGPLSK